MGLGVAYGDEHPLDLTLALRRLAGDVRPHEHRRIRREAKHAGRAHELAVPAEGSRAEWLEPVSEEEYAQLA